MSTKNNPDVNDNPLNREYFDDVLDIFYDNINKTEELYAEAYTTYKHNQPNGFTMGSSRTTVDLIKTLSDIRSNAVSGASALLSAKKTVADLEIKKKAQSVEEEKVDNDKEYIRTMLSEIHRSADNTKAIKLSTANGRDLMSENNRIKSQNILDKTIADKMKSGELSLTKNEKAMKLDFNDMAEVVYDLDTEELKAVKKGTSEPLDDYPVERGQIGNISKVDTVEGLAFDSTGRKVRATRVRSL
ncbi:MAG: hypothetical protein ACRC5M_06775 [Anaeroplasmataceae bacterium]